MLVSSVTTNEVVNKDISKLRRDSLFNNVEAIKLHKVNSSYLNKYSDVEAYIVFPDSLWRSGKKYVNYKKLAKRWWHGRTTGYTLNDSIPSWQYADIRVIPYQYDIRWVNKCLSKLGRLETYRYSKIVPLFDMDSVLAVKVISKQPVNCYVIVNLDACTKNQLLSE